MKIFLIALAFGSLTVHAERSTTLAHLPNSTITAVKTDATGNIYVTGFQGTQPNAHAFVTKLTSTGTVVYSATFAGSKNDVSVAIDIDSTGAAYICGYTTSPDFPVTAGALQTSTGFGFVAKLDPAGNVVYATYIGGTASIGPSGGGLVVDSAGEAFVSGYTYGDGFPATPGAPFNNADNASIPFIMKLDATGGKLLAAIRGIGGMLALDTQSNVYIAGLQASGPTPIPITPGAFQSTYQLRGCGGDAQVGIACSYQYVTKLNSSLSQIVYSTYVTGSYGASASGMSVDSQGQVFLAGTTNSPDYPTTSNAFQPSFIASAAPPTAFCLFFCVFPPPASGYLTQLNSAGTGLVYSTFFSGTQQDTITSAIFTPNAIYISGSANSPDLPGFDGFPSQCLPLTYASQISPDGTVRGAAHTAPGSLVGYNAATGLLLLSTGTDLLAFDLTAPSPPIGCILDSADLKPVASVAPGQLLTLFGQRLSQSPNDGIVLSVNGVASPVLYTGSQQINLQVPFEIAGATQAIIVFSNSQLNLNQSNTLPVSAVNPAAFLDYTPAPSISSCILNGGQYSGGPIPLAYNADGTRNSCKNPAAQGSVIQIFVEGLGVTFPTPTTGVFTANPAPSLNLPITFAGGFPGTVVSASEVPGSISGVWQVSIRLPVPDYTGAVEFTPVVNGVPISDSNLTVWVQ